MSTSQSFVLRNDNALLTIRNHCFIYPRRTQPPIKTMIPPLRCIWLEIEITFNELEEILHVVSTPAGIAELTGEGVEHVVHSGYTIRKCVVNLEMRGRISRKLDEREEIKGPQCIRRWLLLEGTC
jgi:hypothetical protein